MSNIYPPPGDPNVIAIPNNMGTIVMGNLDPPPLEIVEDNLKMNVSKYLKYQIKNSKDRYELYKDKCFSFTNADIEVIWLRDCFDKLELSKDDKNSITKRILELL
jgi:hypothetical protein